MSNSKSLGSSPIGYKSRKSSMGFISDLGVSKTKQTQKSKYPSVRDKQHSQQSSDHKKTKKQVVSYSLEVSLINKVKTIADDKGMFYSSLVSQALKSWISQNG